MTDLPPRLTDAARAVLLTAQPAEKAAAARRLQDDWQARHLTEIGNATMPDRPARPERPELLPPRDMPRRRKAGALGNRIALLHAVAHIELNAIDLAVDAVGRFGPEMGPEFISDWLSVAADEGRHFMLLSDRLSALGAAYGDLPAHDGLWEAAQDTSHNVAARLAVAHMVLEARGLDVTPAMIQRMERHGDDDSAAILRVIYDDEIGHVRFGSKWFGAVAEAHGEEPDAYWRKLVSNGFKGRLKRPFNTDARNAADMRPELYEPLAK